MPNCLRPNILLIFTDQQRADTIGALGNPFIRTPALDRLVREGTAFQRAYTPSPVCMAARCALMTGLPPHLTGCVANNGMPSQAGSFIESLQECGYQTHGIGKMHFAPDPRRLWGFERREMSEESSLDTDYRRFVEEAGYGHVDELNGLRSEYYYIPQPSQLPERLHETRWVGDRSLEFLRRRDRQRPFFLWSSFIKPHPPFENPNPWSRLYRAEEMARPFRPEAFEDLLCFWNKVQNRYKYRDAGTDDFLLRTLRAAYYACISFIDQQIGRILEELGPELDNTLVIFTSDHGEMLGDYGSFGKRCMLDASARIPLVARWPGHFPANARCLTPATLLDIGTTFRAAAGASPMTGFTEAQDLSQLLRTNPEERIIFSQYASGPWGLYMATDGRHKYVWSAADEKEWLFDLQADPKETRNHLPDGPQAEKLRNALLQRHYKDIEAVKDGAWRRYGVTTIPKDPDAGLLYQDSPRLEQRLEALDAYGRPSITQKMNSASMLARYPSPRIS